MSAWLLPESVADVLPAEARRIEDLRRELLDAARSYGYELVMPPLLEHLESLVGAGREELDLRTFKLVDQLSGRLLGLRADTTPQVARIDAHLLNRAGVVRLCYCGPVLHTRPAGLHSTREPLQFGAEIYGHAGLEADLEVQSLALQALARVGVGGLTLDMADIRIVRSLLGGVPVPAATLQQVYDALSNKDAAELHALTGDFPVVVRTALAALLQLYGDAAVLAEARRVLPDRAPIRRALADLAWLAARVPGARVSFDLADLRGYGYYTGTRFAIYAVGSSDVLARGGRYDEIGAVYGRNRPAVGFSFDIKPLAPLTRDRGLRPAVRAPWGEDAGLREAIAALRARGEVVVCMLPGHAERVDEFDCDRELVRRGAAWVVEAIAPAPAPG